MKHQEPYSQEPYSNVFSRLFAKSCLVFVALYFLFQIFLMSHILNGAGLDDAEQLVDSSFLALSYGGSQPPLYTWIAHFLLQWLGTSLFSLQLIKFSLLASTFFGLYLGLRLLGIGRSLAATAMLSLFLLPQIAWESQRALSHSVIGTASCTWLLASFAWHIKSQGKISAVLFGLFAAIAVLGKFNDLLFIVSLFLAAFSIADYRRALCSKNTLLSLVTAAILLTPSLSWTLSHKASVLARANKFAIDASGNAFFDRLLGTGHFIKASISFILVALIAAFFVYLLERKNKAPSLEKRENGEKLIIRIVVIGLLLTWLGVVFSGTTLVKDRWMQPVLFLAAPMMILLFSRFFTPVSLRRFVHIAMALALLAIPLLANYFTKGYFTKGEPSVTLLDYKAIYAVLEQEKPFKTILGEEFVLPGNMRLFDPSLRAYSVETPLVEKRLITPLLVLWDDDETMPLSLKETLTRAGLHIEGAAKVIKGVPFINNPAYTKDIYYYRIDNE